MKFGIVVAEWNPEITEALYEGAYSSLIENGAVESNIVKQYVPGSFELPLGAQLLIDKHKVDAVICLGCVIQGETRHFEFISKSVSDGIMNVGLKYNVPVILGVLTPDNLEQAKARAGGKYGNKGKEAAISAIKMIHIKSQSA